MDIGLISFNFENTPIEIREKIKFTKRNYETGYNYLKDNDFVQESLILSTCNRTEIYYIKNGEDYSRVNQEILLIINKLFSLNINLLKEFVSFKKNDQVIEYLLEVASGLRSQIIGEQQILGQVKKAYQRALQKNTSGRYLNYIFREAITTAKKIRTETGLSEKNISLSSVAVNFIEKKYGNLSSKKVLVIGVGEMSKIVLDILQDKGIENIFATNRTHNKIVKIKDYFPGVIPVNYDKLHKTASEMDIIISSTAAPHFILKKEKMKHFYNNKSNKRIIIIDLGLPRDIDPEISKWPEIEIYNLDHLKEVTAKNKKYRYSQKQKAQNIIDDALCDIKQWQQWQEIVPVIKLIKNNNSRIINNQLEDMNLQLEKKRELKEILDNLAEKMFNDIILNLKELALKECKDYELIEIVKDIFQRRE